MKKVLSFVLVLSMILGSFGMAFAAAPSDVVGKDYEDAVNVLMELGVVEGYKDGTYRPEKVVTRAEMATLIIKALGLNDYAVGKSGFSDMAGHWADAYVAYAASLGFISGYGDGTFRPNQPVTYDQAITMVVQALGYKAEYMVGGYPGAFVAQAKTLGMLDGIKSGAAGANRGDVATLLFNTLPARFVRYDKDGALQAVALKEEGNTTVYDTMLQRLGAEAYTPDGGRAGDAFVVTGGEDSVINLKEYQGAYVTAYQNKDKEIIAIEEVKSVFLSGDWDEDGDDDKFETDDVTYDVEKVAYTTSNTAPETFVNGKTGAVDMTADQKDIVIAAKVSGKVIKEIYSVSKWNASGTVQWDEDLAEELADDDTLNGEKFEMNDNKEIDTDKFALVGVASLKDIKEDDIVTYYVASTGKITKIEVTSEIVTGKVSKVNKTESVVENGVTVEVATQVTIGGKKYDIAKDAKAVETLSVGLGDEGKFFLNSAGEIAYADVTSTEANDYAVVLTKNGYDTAAFGEEAIMKIKLLTADGNKPVYVIEEDFADKLDTNATNEIETVFHKNDIVAYNVDKNGEVDLIKTTTLHDISVDGKLTAKGYLDGHKVADGVVVFVIEDDGDYAVGKLSDVPTNEKFVDASSQYILNEDGEVAVIVLGKLDGADEDAVYGVVVEVASVKNDDDKKVNEVTMFVDGKEVTYLTTGSAVVAANMELKKITFDGSEIDTLTTVAADANGIVSKFSNGNIMLATGNAGYIEVASDVVVYLYNEDKEFEVSKFSAISKGDTVYMYELDGADDDENGIDVIIFKENE